MPWNVSVLTFFDSERRLLSRTGNDKAQFEFFMNFSTFVHTFILYIFYQFLNLMHISSVPFGCRSCFQIGAAGNCTPDGTKRIHIFPGVYRTNNIRVQ